MKHKPSVVIALVLAAVALWPAAAPASFAPRVSLNISPATPRATPTIDATLIEAVGDTPPRRFTLSFPRGFALKHPSGVETCSSRQRRAKKCHRASEIGSVSAVTPAGVRLHGTVNMARKGRSREIAVLLRGVGSIPDTGFVGYARVSPLGSPQLTLDRLPNMALSSLTVRLTGGKRGLVATPRGCGAKTVQGLLTSQLGELAVGLSPVQIAGC
jgi:hypothetical protein